MLLHAVGDNELKVFSSFNLSGDDSKKLSVVEEKFLEYFTPRKNVVYERYVFGKLTQSVGEKRRFIRDDVRSARKNPVSLPTRN
jgi:hypothetical protein